MATAPGPADLDLTPLRNTRDVVPVPSSATNAAVVDSADKFTDLSGRLIDQQNEMALHRADMDASTQLDQIQQQFLTDDDWQTAPTRASVMARAALNTHGAALQGSLTQRAWQMRSLERLDTFDRAMRAQSRQRGVEMAHADLITLSDKAIDTAGDLSQPEDTRQNAAINYAGAVDSYVRRGLLGADDAAADQVRFGEAVKQRVQHGLRGEFLTRIDQDPQQLADDLDHPDGPFRLMDPDDRAQMSNQAHQAAANQSMETALSHTLQTGEVVPETDPSLASNWNHLSEGARLSYAERSANALELHTRAAALGSLAGMSLSEIVAQANSGDEDHHTVRWAAQAHMRGIAADPAAYITSTQPNVALLSQRLVSANAAERAHPTDQRVQFAAVQARQAYVRASIAAQQSLGLSSGQARMHTAGQAEAWAQRVRSLPPAGQQAVLDALPNNMLRAYGDEQIADRAVAELQQAFYAAPSNATAPTPDPATAAAQGADYDSVRGSIVRALHAGSDLDDPRLDVLIQRLSPGDRNRLMADPAINGAGSPQ